LILLKTPNGTPYCIDQTEVTQGQYLTFLEATGNDTSGQTDYCYKNTHLIYEDVEGDFACPKGSWTPKETPDRALMCADPCDAVAYCKWAGKRLCGKVGGGGIPSKGGAELEGDGYKKSLFNDPNVSQFYNACSQGGKKAFSYGDSYNPACPHKATNQGEPVEGCESKGEPSEQVLHLSDSIGEWELTEPFITSSGVPVRGFIDYVENEVEWNGRCDRIVFTSSGNSVGVRCCYDL
jgi:hypothetical protein